VTGEVRSFARQCVAVAVLITVAGVLLATGCAASAPVDSGIEGEVRIGPVSPVETVGTPASAPYSTDLVIRPADGRGSATSVKSDEGGRFRVNLKAGAYIIEAKTKDALPFAEPVTVRVERGRFTRVVIDFDSGIR